MGNGRFAYTSSIFQASATQNHQIIHILRKIHGDISLNLHYHYVKKVVIKENQSIMSYKPDLRQLIIKHFNLNELRILCYDLNIDHEEFGLDPALSVFALKLIKYCDQYGRTKHLIEKCRELRPDTIWTDSSRLLLQDELLGESKPLQHFEPEMVDIPAGGFWMGSNPGNDIPDYETPKHKVYLEAYRIGKYPITNVQYAEFLKQNPNHPSPLRVGWYGNRPPKGKENHPVVAVSWYDAIAYCNWLSEVTGRPYRLPSEAEWEKAARGEDGSIYPWGNDWEPNRCHHNNSIEDTATKPVDDFPAQNPYGCYDMVGNVGEWTNTLWGFQLGQPDFEYPYRPSERENISITQTHYRVFRGAPVGGDIRWLRCSTRRRYLANSKEDKLCGFRITLTKSN